jgi:hypothetical protein
VIRVARADQGHVVIYRDGCDNTLTVPDHIWQQFHNAVMAGQYSQLLYPRHQPAHHRERYDA